MKRLVSGLARVTLALLIVGLSATAAHAQALDKNCEDFPTQPQAQAYFDDNGGSATNNVDGLDRNGNGVPCESLPAKLPFTGPGLSLVLLGGGLVLMTVGGVMVYGLRRQRT